MNQSLKNKLSVAAAIASLIMEYRGKRKWALGLSLVAAGLQWDPTPRQKAMAQKALGKILPESEPSIHEGESLSSADIRSALESSRLVH